MSKRRPALKLWIENLNNAKAIFDSGKFIGLDFNGKSIYRVNLIANVIDKFQGENFGVVTIDDSTGVIEIRDFENGLKDIEIGDVILVIGIIRIYNEKVYITKEIIKKVHPLWLVARKLELEKIFGLKLNDEDKEIKGIKEENKANENDNNLKNLVLEKIKKLEQEKEEANIEDIYLELDFPIENIKATIEQLLEEAKVYEPKPGILKTF